jgi:hypothetical protein
VGTAIWVNGSVIFIYTNSVPLIPFLRTVYYVLLHLYKRLPLGSFFKLLEDGGPSLTSATRLLEVYAREQNREMLRDFYYSDDRRVESAILCMEEASWTKVTAFRKDTLRRLSAHARWMQEPTAKISAIKASQKFFSEDKDRNFEAKVCRCDLFQVFVWG